MLKLDPKTTALVLIDLQKGIATEDRQPRKGSEVVRNSKALAEKFRAANAPVILVHVTSSKDGGEILRAKVDKPRPIPVAGYPAEFSEFVDGLKHDSDIVVAKHNWGAFYNTDMDAQLRRRGIKNIVLGGIATNMGVESTARQAWEANYDVVLAEDCVSAVSHEMHDFAVKNIFPMISRVVQANDIEFS